MTGRLRDLDDDLGAAFRSADLDAPRPEAKAALLAALGVGVGVTAVSATAGAGAVAASSSAAGGAAGAAGAATTAAAAGGSTAVAKTAGAFVVLKWVVASAVVVSSAAVTVHVAHVARSPETDLAPAASVAYVAPARPALARAPAGADEAVPAPVAEAPVAEAPAPQASPTELLAPAPVAPHVAVVEAPAAAPVATVAPVAVAPAAVAPAAVAPAAVAPVAVAPVTVATGAPERGPEAEKHASASRGAVGDEIKLLERARSLVAQGRASEALDAMTAYHRAFPAAVLTEEASSIEIEALAAAGQRDRAQSLGDTFLRQHPLSPFVPRVLRAVRPRGGGGDGPAPSREGKDGTRP